MNVLGTQVQLESTSPGRRWLRVDRLALGIFLVALAVRLLHLWTLRESPLFSHLLIDSVSYDAKAMDFLQGLWLPREGAFYQAPLYPLFLAGVYRIFGHSLLAVRLVQALLGSATSVLVYFVGRRVAGRATGAVAGFLAALYAMAIHFDSEILRSSLVVFLAVLSLHLFLSAPANSRAIRWGVAGFVLGLGAIARPTLLAFIPLAVVWTYVRTRRARVASAAAAIIVAATALAPAAAVTAVNYVSTGQFVLVSSNGGLNFFLGNNPDYEETVSLRPGTRWTLLNREPGVNPRTDPAGWSRYYYGKAAAYIRSDPTGYAALLTKKLILFWNGHEIGRNISFSHIAEHSPFLAFPLVSFRWLAPLALVGMMLAWRKRAPMGLLALYLTAQMVATVAFFVCARHRFVVVPALYVFAGYAAVTLVGELRLRRRSVLPYLLLGVISAVAVNSNPYGASERLYVRPDYELALILRREGRMEECLELLESAQARSPDDPDPFFAMGSTLMILDRHGDAATCFERAAQLEPRYAPTWYNLGLSLRKADELAPAEEALREALKRQPRYWEATQALGDVLEEAGRYDEAVKVYQASSQIAGDRSERTSALMGLVRAHWMAGRLDLSLESMDTVMEMAGNEPALLAEAHLNRARILHAMGRQKEAAEEAARAAQLNPLSDSAKTFLEELRP